MKGIKGGSPHSIVQTVLLEDAANRVSTGGNEDSSSGHEGRLKEINSYGPHSIALPVENMDAATSF